MNTCFVYFIFFLFFCEIFRIFGQNSILKSKPKPKLKIKEKKKVENNWSKISLTLLKISNNKTRKLCSRSSSSPYAHTHTKENTEIMLWLNVALFTNRLIGNGIYHSATTNRSFMYIKNEACLLFRCIWFYYGARIYILFFSFVRVKKREKATNKRYYTNLMLIWRNTHHSRTLTTTQKFMWMNGQKSGWKTSHIFHLWNTVSRKSVIDYFA